MGPLVHHVFFWLKNPKSETDKKQLIEGIKTLKSIPEVEDIHVGIPASTEKRDVVDNSFSVTEMLTFLSEADEAIYQAHPIHLKFVENNQHLWDKVLVYDSKSII
ncbi:Dabb family protein [Mariniflexile sp. AS56]|uniref:Dabb family protein n=1 Tax=Mariniflexile sp. AS56 TaxID=3063957 RepID=UPI0026EA3A51|nr:Dabb family protein [Mariniflexile sp. AS56]MDO7173575.1 Dabb family protein [Mariniflexile sp. AS56]